MHFSFIRLLLLVVIIIAYLHHLGSAFLMFIIFQPKCILHRNLRAKLRVHDWPAAPISLEHGGGESE